VQFSSTTRTICQGQTVQYTDNSYNGVTEWNWNFAGGTPAAATEADPTVTYDTPGTYDVSLTVGNGSQTQSATQPQYVQVLACHRYATLPFAEGLRELSNSLPSDGLAPWTTRTLGRHLRKWSTDSRLHRHPQRAPPQCQRQQRAAWTSLFSNTVDASHGPAGHQVSFRYAFAQRNSSNDDALRLYLSLDCGESWSLRRKPCSPTRSSTAPNTSGSPFVPERPGPMGLL
jgi:PKD repeat protein